MWRTASTYVWKKFRAQPQYRAYYEPLHEMLIKPREQVLSIGDRRRASSLRHPEIDSPYFTEFPFAGEGGAEFFEKPLSYERYCLREDEKDGALHRYIRNLLLHASRRQQRPVLQFNRGLLRSAWLSRNFSPVNILVLRKPANVWKSFLSFSDGAFAGVLCVVLGQNKSKWPLSFFPDWLELPRRIGPAIEDDYAAYAPISAELTSRMYPSFFDLFLVSTLHAARYADCILDMDELSSNSAARAAAQTRLRRFGIEIDLSDCSVPSYDLSAPQEREWLAYENFAICLHRARLPADILLPLKALHAHSAMLGDYFRDLLGEFVCHRRSTNAANVLQASAAHTEGLRLFNNSRKQESLQPLGQAVALDPTSERWNDWATAQAACSRLMLAELGYRQALKMDRWNHEACANLGALLASLARNSEALPLLELAKRASLSGATVELGQVIARVHGAIAATSEARENHEAVRSFRRLTTQAPAIRGNRAGFTVFFTGLSGAGKSSLAAALRVALLAMGVPAITLLDGDEVRAHLSSELGFSRAHRDLNVRRLGFVAAEVARHGGTCICAAIAPFDEARRQVRGMVEDNGPFVLVHVATPLATCEQRDPKGLYAKARAGVIPQFTGVSDPYEEPLDAEIRVDTSRLTLEQGTREILSYLIDSGLLPTEDSVPAVSTVSAKCSGMVDRGTLSGPTAPIRSRRNPI